MTPEADLDLREFVAELDDVHGPWDMEVVIALRRAEEARSYEQRAAHALAVGDVAAWIRWRGWVAHTEGIARAWCDLAGFP